MTRKVLIYPKTNERTNEPTNQPKAPEQEPHHKMQFNVNPLWPSSGAEDSKPNSIYLIFCLVSLFSGISSFMGYFKPKP